MFYKQRVSYGNQSLWQNILEKLIVGFVVICLVSALVSCVYLLVHPQLFSKLWIIMTHNMNFWFIMVVGVGFGLWRKFSNPDEFQWKELPIQLIIGIIVTIGCFGAFLFWSSGLKDTEVWSGKAVEARLDEEWRERVHYTVQVCTGSGKNQSCHTEWRTRIDHHPEQRTVITSNSERISVSRSAYRKYVGKFGNEKKVILNRANQVSIGDGNRYVTKWSGTDETIVSTAVPHTYVNYLKASKSLHKRSGTIDVYEKNLLDYPKVTKGSFGRIDFDRVLISGVNIPAEWKKQVDEKLDRALAHLGTQKQVNLLVYAVNADRGFLHALEEHWIYGKKNDVVLVMGMTEFPTVQWAGVMIFHGNETLRVNLRDAVETMKDVSDPNVFASMIVDNVQKEFKRVPMTELNHLLYDVEMPWWSIILVWVMTGMVVFVTSRFLENN